VSAGQAGRESYGHLPACRAPVAGSHPARMACSGTWALLLHG